MKLSIHSSTTNHGTVATVVEEVRRTAAAGLSGYWAPMLSGVDTLTALAVAGAAVPGVELCTAVVPIPVRSPFALAQQAVTLQEVTAGRLVLGLGTSHEALVRDVFRGEWQPPLATMRAYLDDLLPLLESADPRRLRVAAPRPDVVLGAVNPRMAELAVERADGVVTWAAGLRTVEEVLRPALRDRAVGRPFRIVTAVPFCVTDDEAAARAGIHTKLGAHDGLPSYQRVLRREGVTGVAGVAVVGDEASVDRQLERFAAAGVTEFAAHVVASGPDLDRTWSYLAERNGGR